MQQELQPKAHEVFKSIREGLGLTPEQMAEKMELHPTTIAQYEDGSRKLPRQLWFYSHLAGIEGIEPSNVISVLRATAAPAWIFEQVVRPREVLNPVPGVVIPLYFSKEEINDDQLEIIKDEVGKLVTDFYRRRLERYEQSKKDNPDPPQL